MKKVTVIGGGVVGSITALHLSKLGHEISIIDPQLNNISKKSKRINGSQASLGILMGYVYRKSSGRSWRLRQRSMELWPKLVEEIAMENYPLKIETPLIQITSSTKEYELMKKIVKAKEEYGLELLESSSSLYFTEILEQNILGGLISYQDGRIDPLILITCLIHALKIKKVRKIKSKVISIRRNADQKNEKWSIGLENGSALKSNFIIMCAALSSSYLLNSLGYDLNLEPILGQVIELDVKNQLKTWNQWPAVLSYQNTNLIPLGNQKILIGSTLESGFLPSNEERIKLQRINENAPKWIVNASIKRQWNGIRARPLNQPAPILAKLEEGLIVNTGHYRNGVLLAPGCAEWVGEELKK